MVNTRLYMPKEWTHARKIATGVPNEHLKFRTRLELALIMIQEQRALLPAAWIEEATTSQILQNPNVDVATSTSDWNQGYGYQIWRCRHNGFRTDVRDGQFIVVLPEQQAVVVLTANIGDMQAELNLVWEYLLPRLR